MIYFCKFSVKICKSSSTFEKSKFRVRLYQSFKKVNKNLTNLQKYQKLLGYNVYLIIVQIFFKKIDQKTFANFEITSFRVKLYQYSL